MGASRKIVMSRSLVFMRRIISNVGEYSRRRASIYFTNPWVLAAERRKSLATADRPWLRFTQESGAAVLAKESFAATAASLLLVFEIHGLSAVAKLLHRFAAKTEGFVKYVIALEEQHV